MNSSVHSKSDLSSEKMSGTWERLSDAGNRPGYCFPQASLKLKETKMAKKLFGSLMSMFERKTLKDNDIRTWARVEYSDDWEFAYNHIKNYGTGPRQGVYK